MMRARRQYRPHCNWQRAGFSTLDYVLALGIMLPMLAVILPQGRRAMQLVYEMTTTLVAWPFL